MSDYVCPYCGFSSESDLVTAKSNVGYKTFSGGRLEAPVQVIIRKCPHCDFYSYHFHVDNPNGQLFSLQYPVARMAVIPDYIPQAIRADYMEAVSVLNDSPKAAATLARRCLQGMIHDFWDIHEKNLNAEITALSGKVPAAQWKAIDGLRKLGNIGAHMEASVDLIIEVEPDEAEKLIRLIELLIKAWYIARHDEEKLYADIIGISDAKDAQRKSLRRPDTFAE